MSDQVHGISTVKVFLTKAEYVLCRKCLKIVKLVNFSGKAILQTKLQGFTIRLKNDAWKLDGRRSALRRF